MLVALASLSAGAKTWTLDECVTYAIDHNIDVQSRKVSALEGELAVTEAKDRFLPQVQAYGSQSFNFGRGLTADNTYANRNTSSFSVGANLSLPIFQGLRAVRQLSYSRTALKATLEQVEAAKDDVTLNVISQYLQALYASEMLQVARVNLGISQSELDRRQALLDAGRLPGLDIHEARAQVAQDELSVTNAVNDSIIARLDLAQLLNLPDAEGFDIAPLGDDERLLPSPDDVFANALQYNHTMRAGRLQEEAAEKNVALARTAYIPRGAPLCQEHRLLAKHTHLRRLLDAQQRAPRPRPAGEHTPTARRCPQPSLQSNSAGPHTGCRGHQEAGVGTHCRREQRGRVRGHEGEI